jgi:hypothetical protein
MHQITEAWVSSESSYIRNLLKKFKILPEHTTKNSSEVFDRPQVIGIIECTIPIRDAFQLQDIRNRRIVEIRSKDVLSGYLPFLKGVYQQAPDARNINLTVPFSLKRAAFNVAPSSGSGKHNSRTPTEFIPPRAHLRSRALADDRRTK